MKKIVSFLSIFLFLVITTACENSENINNVIDESNFTTSTCILDLFEPSFYEWFGETDPVNLGMPRGGVIFNHPENSKIYLVFAAYEYIYNVDPNLMYPAAIDVPLSMLFPGTNNTSVYELTNYFGDDFIIFDSPDNGEPIGFLRLGNLNLTFDLSSENDELIDRVFIMKDPS